MRIDRWASIPGIGAALLPKLPVCWPVYGAIQSSHGLRFLIHTQYLLAVSSACLLIAIACLSFRARHRHGYGPPLLGLFSTCRHPGRQIRT